MKKRLYRLLGCVLLLAATALPIHAADGVRDTLMYQICPGDTLTIGSQPTVIHSNTVLRDTLHGLHADEDSITMYVVNVYPSFRQVDHRSIVMGQTFEWCGMTIQSAGTFTKVYKTVNGCDSTYVMVVSEVPGVQAEMRSLQSFPFCDSIEWDGTMYTESKVFVDTLTSLVYGCDSIVTTVLQKGTSFRHYDTDTLFIGSTLLWHGQTITEGGEYWDTHTNKFGCDSTYVLRVITKAPEQPQPKVITTRKSICEGDVFEWRGVNRGLTGTYYDTAFVNGTTIDSLFVLHLKVNPISEQTENVSFSSFPQYYRGVKITAPGIYPVTYVSSSGCDSIINVIANRQAIIREETATICPGETYTWRTKRLTESQTCTDVIKAKDGSDSIVYILHLNVRSIPETHITRTICNGDSYVFGTQILTEAGVYRHSYKQDGCDSTVILSLNVADVDTIVQVKRLEPGSSYTWPVNGRTYSSTGTYQEIKTNRFGCDSVLRLVLTMNRVDTIDTVATICPGERLIWHTLNEGQSGHYENVETNPHGDMTYYRLDLTVLEQKEQEVHFSICGDEEISFNGKTYSQAGHYYDKGTCDTLYHIIVHQSPLQVYTTNAMLDGIHPYAWSYMENGVAKDSTFAIPGTYEFKSVNATTGCNDVWRLVLRQDDNDYHFVEQVTLCEGEPYSWRGHDNLSLIPGTTVYKEELKTVSGKDSIYELQVTVLPLERSNQTITFCGSTVWKGVEYTQSAVVYDTLTAANGCDHIITVSLRHVDSFFRRDTATIVQGEQLFWHGQHITTDGVYTDRQENQYGCDSIYELHVGIEAAAPQTNMITTIAEICEGDYFEWRGNKYYNKGLYPDTVFAQTLDERDTIYVLNLNVTPVERRHEEYSFCEGEKLESIYGVNYTNKAQPGIVYRDTVTVPNPSHIGCPDTVYLDIYKYPISRHTETKELLAGDTIRWHEQVITRPGTYTDEQLSGGLGGCKTIDYLRVVNDTRETAVICSMDTAADIDPKHRYPYVWREDTIYTSGLWTDTIFDSEGLMKEFYSLDLTITQPYDTAVYLHACDNRGVVWRDELFLTDTAFIDHVPVTPYDPTAPCDSIFHVHIRIDHRYAVTIDTTLCEHELPLIIGRQDPDTIWAEGTWRHPDMTACGCDSTITVNLHIIPKLTKNDSTFICEDEIKKHPVYLGDTITPWFDYRNGGLFHGTWEDKWHGVKYTQDTIVWDCNHEYFHHIIVRPSQKVPKDTTYYLCQGDSVQLFWPKDTMIRTEGVYYDTVPMGYDWKDAEHGYSYHNQQYVCDSVTRWTVKFVYPEVKETTQHILLGDSVYWGGAWRYYTGDYDSIGVAQAVNSDNIHCSLTYTLHLITDSSYYFRDTIELCTPKNKTWSHVWSDGYEQFFTVGDQDETKHFVDSLITYDRRDSIYDLLVNYRVETVTYLDANLCYGDSMRFGLSKAHTPRFISKTGEYRDTLVRVENGCDSIIVLRLNVYPDYTKRSIQHIADKEVPYVWYHIQGGDTISADTLRAAGEYSYTFIAKNGCDSIDWLTLQIHPTYIFTDTVTICQRETPYTWFDKQDIYETGVYTKHLQTHDGYDSTYVRYVQVVPTINVNVLQSICEGDSYKFGEHILTEQGVYVDTLVSSSGCDSVVSLTLQIHPVLFQTENKRIFEGDSILFDGQWLKESGVYEKRVVNANNCTDTYQFILTVLPIVNVDTTAYVCDNELPYRWHGYEYNETGDYTIPISWNDSTRTTMTLHLTVRESFYGERNVNICEGSTYIYKNREYKSSCSFYDTIPSTVGCDSIIKYIISVQPTYDRIDTVHISDKQSYDFNGRILTNSGTYEWAGKTVNGCDSLQHLVLIVHPSYFFTDTVDICQPDTLNWRDLKIMKSGVYTDSLLTAPYGFDSVYQVVVHVHPSYFQREQFEIGEGEILKIHGKDISKPAIYFDTLRTIHGCDSIFHIVVNPKRTREFYRTAEICQGEYYEFFDRKLTHTGDYTYTSQYKDSIVYLSLTVKPISVTEKRIVITDKKNYHTYDGQIYENLHMGDNLFVDTLRNQYGCDSIKRLVICMTTRYSEWIPIPLCPGSDVRIDGQIITEAGLYMFERRSRVTGEMDSLYRVEVYDSPAYDFPTEQRTICEGDTLYYGDKAITRGGHYDFELKTVDGCDSLLHLDLTVHPTYHYITDAMIADYESYTWLGRSYVETGVYDRTWPTVNDCDSTYTLRLTVVPTLRDTITETICNGQSLTWRGKVYTVDGYYTDTVRMLEGNFSAIYAMRLIVAYPTDITSARASDYKEGADDIEIVFTYTGQRPTSYSILFDTHAKQEGFTDIYDAPIYTDNIATIPIPQRTGTCYNGKPTYIRPDWYSMRLVLDNGVCGVSRSDSMAFLIKYPSWIIEQNWDDVVAPLKPDCNCGYEFTQTEWYLNDILQPNNGLGYLHNDAMRPGDKVVMSAKRKGESYSIPTHPLIIQPLTNSLNEYPIIVYPTQVPRHTPIVTVEAPQAGTYEIFSSTGLMVSSGRLEEGQTQLTLPGSCGIYFIRAHEGNEVSSHKVIIY